MYDLNALSVKSPSELSYPIQFAFSDFLPSGKISEKFPIKFQAVQNQSSAQLDCQPEYEDDNFTHVIGGFEISNSFYEEFNQRAQYFLDSLGNYVKRIQDLKEIGLDDGISLNPDSISACLKFFVANPFLKPAGLITKENGNLRAIWEGENEVHVGLQFLGDQSLQYVIFKQRTPEDPVSRVSGLDTMDGIMHQIEAFDLKEDLFFYEG